MYYKPDSFYEYQYKDKYDKAAELFVERWQLKRRLKTIEDEMRNHSFWSYFADADDLDCFG